MILILCIWLFRSIFHFIAFAARPSTRGLCKILQNGARRTQSHQGPCTNFHIIRHCYFHCAFNPPLHSTL